MSVKTTESPFLKVVKFTLKALGLILVFGTIIFFLWRVFSSGNPKELENLTPNRPLREAAEAADVRGEALLVQTQYQKDNITSVMDKNYGYFGVTDAKFIPEAGQVQVLFRYNNSTIRHLKEDYSLPEMPDRDADLYDVTLYVVYDLTPDVTSDNAGDIPEAVKGVRYHATTSIPKKKNLYNFRKLVFDNVDFGSEAHPILAVYVDFYYVEDIDYEKDSYGTLPLYFYDVPWEEYEVGKKEMEAIRNFE